MTNSIHRIGILTGGGDCSGLNPVIRAVVKTAINRYHWDVLGIEDGFEGLILPDKVRRLDLGDVRGILHRGGTILGTTNRVDPFHYEMKGGGQVLSADVSEQVIARVKALEIDALVVCGGDGTLRITHELIERGLGAVAVPKTIDNDLQGTAVTFGFDTAVNTAMDALDKLHSTAESHHRVIILEVMGRDAGWIALNSGIAGGADVILIPEIPYELDTVISHIEKRSSRGARFSLVVAAEGACPVGGEMTYQTDEDAGGSRRLGGIGQALATQIKGSFAGEVRVTVLGHLQRGGTPSAFDRLLASRFGALAVHSIAQGKLGHMVALQNDRIVAIPIVEAVGRQKLVPLDSDVLLTALGLDICLGSNINAI